jgi:putative acetyltransferase
MIRKLLNGDIDRVADIWLKTNLKAHYFISNQYWKSNYELVKEMLSQSEVYVFEADKMIQGFVGLNDEYIEGIFVSDEMQSCGIGKLLLDYIKDKKVVYRTESKELEGALFPFSNFPYFTGFPAFISEMICIFPYFCPYEIIVREIRESFI